MTSWRARYVRPRHSPRTSPGSQRRSGRRPCAGPQQSRDEERVEGAQDREGDGRIGCHRGHQPGPQDRRQEARRDGGGRGASASSPSRRVASRATAQVSGARQAPSSAPPSWPTSWLVPPMAIGHCRDEAGQRQPQVEGRPRQRQGRGGVAPQDVRRQAHGPGPGCGRPRGSTGCPRWAGTAPRRWPPGAPRARSANSEHRDQRRTVRRGSWRAPVRRRA